MKVYELKKILENASDDTLVVISGDDHNYLEAHCRLITGIKEDHNQYCEDFGEELISQNKRIPILLVE